MDFLLDIKKELYQKVDKVYQLTMKWKLILFKNEIND